MPTKVCPGSLLISKRAPDTGLWTVVACRVARYPGPWEQLELLLLNRSTLASLEIEKGSFHERWDVVRTSS